MKTKLFSFLFVLIFCVASAQIPTSGLLHEFKFNNSTMNESATKSFINSATGNAGGLIYGLDRFGNANAAVFKNGAFYLYNTSLDNLPQGSSPRSISIWIKPDAVNTDNIIFACGTGSANLVYGASFNPSTIYNFTYSSNIAATNSVLAGLWKHVVLTYNGSVSRVYVDGNLVNQGTLSLNTTGLQFYLGTLFNTTPSFFTGWMDDLLIYNRELTVSEVSQIYINGTPAGNVTVAEYSFDNTYTNINGNSPFLSNGGTSFVTDRHGNSSGALNINSTGTSATIVNLPYGNSARTISFWAKLNVMNNPYNMTFSYGQPSDSNAFGGSFKNNRVEFFGYYNNFAAVSTNTAGVWYYFTYTYDGNEAKIYKDGVFLQNWSLTLNTLNNNDLFKLGIGVGGEYIFNGAIDDLKIFNYVLTDTQISNLYTNNTLSSSDFSQNNLKVAMYPNPVNDILNIDIENEIKSVEIYNIQGQRVIQSNSKQIETSFLNSGIYMVRIEDINGGIATQKLIKK